jgi:hypothetical protein
MKDDGGRSTGTSQSVDCRCVSFPAPFSDGVHQIQMATQLDGGLIHHVSGLCLDVARGFVQSASSFFFLAAA